MIDLRKHADIIDAANAILNNGGICEIKNETKDKKNAPVLAVVEQRRTVKLKKQLKD